MAGLNSSEKTPHDDRSSSLSDQTQESPDKLKHLDLEGQDNAFTVQSDSETGDVGRQIELEAENSIKYRTCSWQKVWHTPKTAKKSEEVNGGCGLLTRDD